MTEEKKSWLRLRVEDGLRRGLTQAYETVKVDPQKFLLQLRTGYGLPISTYDGVFSVSQEQLDLVAVDVIRSGMKVAAVEGAGFGLGGLLTIVPDLSILAGITIRTIQKLSLIYGFQYATDTRSGGSVGRRRQRRRRGHQPRVIGKGSGEPVRAACHPAHRRADQQRGGRALGRTPGSRPQLRHRRHAQLLFRAHLGTPRHDPLPPEARPRRASLALSPPVPFSALPPGP